MLKKFFISIIKSLIILLVATLIFSSVTLDFPDLIKGLFGDIFAYASHDAQKQVISNLAGTCSSLNQVQSNPLTPDLSRIGAVCKNYKSGKINDKEFFFNVVGGTFSSQQTQQIEFFDKYNRAMNYLNSNKMIYFLILLVLIIALYLLIMDTKLYILSLTGILFSLGIIIMLPYFAIVAYEKFVGFDTTPILSSLLGAGNILDAKAIASVILLLFMRTYNNFIIFMGILFLGVGVAGKVYSWKLKKQSRKAEIKTEKKPEKGAKKNKEAEKETDQEADKKDRGRKRTTKEILDELEEMQKKKMKEKENN